jgi:predicted patatin/cPLA2 family phospholipase
MRASYSMGGLLALEEMGLINAFDVVIGSSAGAINGAYFVAGQAKIATEVYSKYVTDTSFINPFRLNKIMDVDYLIKELSSGEMALDTKRVVESGVDLRFNMIEYPSAKECEISVLEKPNEIMKLINASIAIPAISNEIIEIDGQKYIDGAIVDPAPLKSAIQMGCTDIVVILTRSRKFRRKPSSLAYGFLSKTYFKDWPKESKDDLFRRFSLVNDLYDFIWKHEGDNGSYRVSIIAPESDTLAGVISTNKQKVLDTIKRGREDGMRVFG